MSTPGREGGIEGGRGPLSTLRGFMRPRAVAERCELCGTALASEHAHLIRLESRQMVCACEACGCLFPAGATGQYARIPRQIVRLTDFTLSDEQWDALLIPIDLAFFFHSTPAGQVVAVYPSPAGATESLLRFETWHEIAAGHPRLAGLTPDVEALLVNRVRQRTPGATPSYLVVPIDQCYRLVGLMRSSWRGLSGGVEVWQRIGEFFAALDARADRPKEVARA